MALTIDQQMVLRTLRLSHQPLSASAIEAQWAPTWTLAEVEGLLKDLMRTGHVQAQGRERKRYTIVPLTEARRYG